MLKKTGYKVLRFLTDKFWIISGLMVCIGILAAIGLIEVDRNGWLPDTLLTGSWLYNGGGTGARTLLGAVVSSTIGVAGTVFSITIAALSLAAGQMGPRLLRNFTQDRGNQITLVEDAERNIGNRADLRDVRHRFARFDAACSGRPDYA